MRKIARISIAVMAVFMVCQGCSFGPKTIEQGHIAYNEGAKAAADDELLLNIIRLRYFDTIEFLATNSISAQTSITVGIGAELGVERDLGSVLALPRMSYSDRPTITFTPQRGREFAKRLVEPISISTFSHLAASGWPVHQLMRLLVTEVNGIINEPIGEAESFGQVANLLGEFQNAGELLIGFVERQEVVSEPISEEKIRAGDLISAANSGYRFRHTSQGKDMVLTRMKPIPVMWINLDSDRGIQLKSLLRLKEDLLPPIELRLGAGLYHREIGYKSIVMRTRSLLGAIAYLSHGVEPPESHVAQGLTTHDWPFAGVDPLNIENFFQIRASLERPPASLAVKYRDMWFYIDETDKASKTTFLILAEFYRLAISAGPQSNVPLLTLPVGGP